MTEPVSHRFTAEELRALARRHVDAENAHDLDAVMRTVAERQVRFEDKATGKVFDTHADVRTFYSQFALVPDLHLEVRSLLVDVERAEVAVELVMTGTFAAPYLGFWKRRRRATMISVNLLGFDADGLLCKEIGYYDQAGLLASMGLVVDPKTPAGQLALLIVQSPIVVISGIVDAIAHGIATKARGRS